MEKNYKFFTSVFLFSFICFIGSSFTEVHAAKSFFSSSDNFYIFENLFNKKQKYVIFLIFFLPSIYFLQRKKWSLFIIFILIQLFIIIYWDSIILWVQNLAGDSLSEVDTYNLSFIITWLNSIFIYFEPNFQIKNFIKFYLIGLFFLYTISIIFKKNKTQLLYTPAVLLGFYIILFININILHLIKNINTQESIKNNYTKSLMQYKSDKKINFIIYIGESSTSMLANDNIKKIQKYFKKKNLGKLDLFENVYTSHTHSTPSLLHALSIPSELNYENLIKLNVDRKSKSMFSFLDKNVKKSYVSNTGINGFNNLHYPIFFNNFENKVFLKNTDFNYEKEFFINEYKEILKKKRNNNLIVFHSAIGHAPYAKNLPPSYVENEIEKYTSEDLIKITGNNNKYSDDISNYLLDINYNFEIIQKIISNIPEETSTIFIYFSDHGESVFTGNGHDSSRLVHEMLRVPFFIFYNKKFLNENLEIVNKINLLKEDVMTLDILPKIFLNIYNLDKNFRDYYDLKIKKYEKIIFKRKKKNNISYIDLNYKKINLPNEYIPFNEKDTDLHILANNLDKSKICYHAANTLARVKRGLHITDCLEIDLVITDDNYFIYHPPSKNIFFTLDDLFDNLDHAKSIWIDAKNINENNCNNFTNKIIDIKKKIKIMIEFPSYTDLENTTIISCLKKMNMNNINASYYMPNDIIDNCLTNLSAVNVNCKNLINIIKNIDHRNFFNNISFDYKFSDILDYFGYKPQNLLMNTWHIEYDELTMLDLNKYNLIIPFNSNFNKNIFK